nr:SLC13 family permease [Lysinibacillus timonensis]
MTPLVATLIILVIAIFAFMSEKLSFIVITPFIIVSLILTGVLTPEEALSGFANTNVVMFVAMFVVGGAIVKTSLLDRLQVVVVKYKDKPKMLVFISCTVGAVIALITSQTAAAAILLPLLVGIANEIGFSRSRLLYPAIVSAGGGVALTFLGQGAANMTWSDVMIEAGGTIAFGLWDFFIGRFPILIITIIYFITIGYKLLPNIPNEQFDDFRQSRQNTKTNLVLSPIKEKIAIAICSLTIVLMFLSDFIHVELYIIATIGAALLILTGVLSDKEAMNSIHWQTVFLFAGVLPLSAALTSSGAAKIVGDWMVNVLGDTTNPYVIIFFFLMVPLLLTQVMSDLGTIAVFIPLACAVAINIGIDPRAAVMATYISACINTLSPMANPAQSMIVGPGGYRMKDYMKCGLPLTALIVIFTVIYLPIVFPLYK